jgi:hypothetical protein
LPVAAKPTVLLDEADLFLPPRPGPSTMRSTASTLGMRLLSSRERETRYLCSRAYSRAEIVYLSVFRRIGSVAAATDSARRGGAGAGAGAGLLDEDAMLGPAGLALAGEAMTLDVPCQ